MAVELAIMCIALLIASALVRGVRDRRELGRLAVTPEELHELLASDRDLVVVDVREPLDLLGDSVIIPGALWFAPQEVIDDPSLLPAGRELIVYCTCPNDKTSRAVLRRALAMGFSRIKLLNGGLDGWRARGYPVEAYVKPFRLDSHQNGRLAAAS
ncbi:MAG: rhodanese-like domain-containing protein [Terracidiphilus sp.]